jgi:hypothetical protein
MWMLPEYRHLCVAQMFMKMGVDLADEHDVETYGEFVQMSQGLGVKFGFQLISKNFFKMNIENPTEESQAMIKDFQSEPIHLMVRPKKSDSKGTKFVGLRDTKL